MGKPLTWLAINEQIDNPRTKLLLVTMAALAKEEKGKPNMVYAKKETLMKFSSLSQSCFYKALTSLKGKRLISPCTSDYGQISYILNLDSQIGNHSQIEKGDSQIEKDNSQIENPLSSNPNTNPNTLIIEKELFLERVKMGAAIPPDWADEWYEGCIRKGNFLYPNGKIRPYGGQLKHMVGECQSWFNKTERKTAPDLSKPESTYEKRQRYDALLLLLKEHHGNPDSDVRSTKEDVEDYRVLLKERKKLLNEMGRKR
jgi:hypothetical protein